MTISHNRQNLSSLDAANEIEIYDDKGRLDPVASAAANLEVFSESNVVRIPGGSIDHVASAVKHAAAKAVVFARKK